MADPLIGQPRLLARKASPIYNCRPEQWGGSEQSIALSTTKTLAEQLCSSFALG